MNSNNRCTVCQKVYLTENDFLSDTSRWRLCDQGHLWFNCRCGSTLMIRKGKFDWYSPERFMGAEAKGVFNRLGNLKDLPHMPNSVMELQVLLQDPETSPKAMAQAVRKEPVIAAQILRIAEGLRATRNPGNPPIRSLEHAIVYIGYRTLGDLLLSCALKTFPLPESAFDARAFWDEAYVRGVVAEALMKRLSLDINADEAYLAASLCDIGKLVTAFCFAPLATKIAHDVTNPKEQSTWRQAEAAYNFPDHAVLGEIAATVWGFPGFIRDAARKHHVVPSAQKAKPLDIYELTAFANQMTHWALLQPHRMESDVTKAFAQRCGLTDRDIELIAEELIALRKAVLGVQAA